ncbi:alpha-aspartyl dipeptidase [Neocloeon triangulifer]|uniref:alpha-aspartyl dipeptidase n=1 Tax=Neocloeon triangulifer TaxID=2078957 RepID=UPI00286F84F3|nr:alpha-aspartyl dipeptidase [Neocloeon triangulifer]
MISRMMANARRILLLSSSTVHGSGYLEYAAGHIKEFLQKSKVKTILFVPYALKDHNEYLNKVQGPLKQLGYAVEGIHEATNAIDAIKKAEAIYIGGGNTFLLLKTLYDLNLIEPIKERVLKDGIPYIGSSAGSNVATASINTTNDMPIVWPPTLTALALVPFNINPHYIDFDPDSKHKGETREERISQYHEIPGSPPVLGLREGAILQVEGDVAKILGTYGAKLFTVENQPQEFRVGEEVSFLLK